MKTKNLIDALNITKPAVSGKSTVDQSDCYAFMDGRVFTFNDQLCINHPVEGLDVEGVVSSKDFYKFISKLTEEEIDIDEEKNKLVVKTGNSKAGFSLGDIYMPIEEIGEPDKWYDLNNFTQALKFVIPCASKDTSLPIYNSINMDAGGWIEATDSYRICRYYTDIPVDTTLLPLKSAKVVARMQPVKIAQTNGWIHFACENDTIISCRVYNESFPDTGIFMEEPDGYNIEFPDKIEKQMDKMDTILQSESFEDQSATIEISGGIMRLSVSTGSNYYKEDVESKSDQNIKWKCTPALLKEILKIKKTAILSSDFTKLYFSDDGWVYLVSLRQ